MREELDQDHITMRPIKIVCPKSNTILTIAPSPEDSWEEKKDNENKKEIKKDNENKKETKKDHEDKKPKIVFIENNEDTSDYNTFWMLKYKNEEDKNFSLEHLLYKNENNS